MTTGVSAILEAYAAGPKQIPGTARCGVVYWYDQPPVQAKQEIRKSNAVRRMAKSRRIEMLAHAGAEIAREIERLS